MVKPRSSDVLISPEKLRELLHYDAETGRLWWKERRPEMFTGNKRHTSMVMCRAWNATYVGKEAFCFKGSNGYWTGYLFDRRHLAHRVIWALVRGAWPEETIDHINGDKTDNRLLNLRCVPHNENCRNQKIGKNNTSGVMGVHWRTDSRKWSAYISVNRHKKRLGSFASFEEAVSARKLAEVQYGYHPNHGRSA